MDLREQRGQQIVDSSAIIPQWGGWQVPSQSGPGKYLVTRKGDGRWVCACEDAQERYVKCKHAWAVQLWLDRQVAGQNPEGPLAQPKPPVRPAPPKRDWRAYSQAQTQEKDRFMDLLYELCQGLPSNAPEGPGRKPLALSDALFAAVFKIYTGFSGRRSVCDMVDATNAGYLSKTPHYNTFLKVLEQPETTQHLTNMILESGKPLAALESTFAADSSGFSTSRFTRWFDIKYGEMDIEQDWVKIHLMCGTNTHVVTAVEIHDQHTHDSPILPSLLATTAKTFQMVEVSADKGYSSYENLETVASYGAAPFIMFKANARAQQGKNNVWSKMLFYYNFRRDEFLDHYHRRSNVESVFSMVKAKFGDSIRSRNPVSMRNEALAKILCHNICCNISAMVELGVEAEFYKTKTA